MACHRASIGRQCGILRDNLSIPLPQSRLFPSRGVARPTLTLRYVHYSFAQCLPCVVQVENMRRFADGIDMRVDPGVCLSRQALGVRQTSRGHKAPRSSALVVCGVVLLLPGLACGPARSFRQTHFAPLPRVDVFGRSPSYCRVRGQLFFKGIGLSRTVGFGFPLLDQRQGAFGKSRDFRFRYLIVRADGNALVAQLVGDQG